MVTGTMPPCLQSETRPQEKQNTALSWQSACLACPVPRSLLGRLDWDYRHVLPHLALDLDAEDLNSGPDACVLSFTCYALSQPPLPPPQRPREVTIIQLIF